MMRSILRFTVAAIVCASLPLAGVATAQDGDDEVKYTISVVMKQGMKGGLVTKVASGQASDEEKATLKAMFVDMAKQEPPRGTAESWEALNKKLVMAADAAIAGDVDAGSQLKTAANCKACHTLHK